MPQFRASATGMSLSKLGLVELLGTVGKITRHVRGKAEYGHGTDG